MSSISNRPGVSVLLPVRNAKANLAQALDSLIGQTFVDFEVLLQDDGSTDGSRSIEAAFARRDDRIRVDVASPRGLVPALNAAAARARGDLLVRMDADDVAAPERLERLAEAARARPGVGFFSHRVRYFPREAVHEGMRRYEAWLDRVLTHDEIVRNRFVECPLPHPSWAVRRGVFTSLGGYRDGPFPEDYEFFLRAVEEGVRFHKLEDVLLSWREGPDRLSRGDPRYSLDAFFDLKARFLVPLLRRSGRRIAIAGAGSAGRRWATRLCEGGLDVAWFLEIHPRRIGRILDGARVLAWDDVDGVRDAFVLNAVGPSGRDDVSRRLDVAGFDEGTSWLGVQ